MLINVTFSITFLIHPEALNVSLCDENKQWKSPLQWVKAVSQEHTVSQDKGEMLGG